MNAPTFSRRRPADLQRGIAAVELAILMSVLVVLLYGPFNVVHSLLQVTVAQRAAGNAARMMAMYPPYQREDLYADPRQDVREMLADALSAASTIDPATDPSRNAAVDCPVPFSYGCQDLLVVPGQVRVSFNLDVTDPLSPPFDPVSTTVSMSTFDNYAN